MAVARALVGRPRLLLADEPTGQLDHEAGELVVDALLAAADRADAALVVATHDPTVQARLDQQWTMSDGRLAELEGSSWSRLTWAVRLLTRQPGRVLAAAAGVAVAVGLLVSVGIFLASSKREMTTRSIATVAVDWQVEVQRGADPASTTSLVAGHPRVTDTATVLYGTTTGFEATVDGSTQTTGPGIVLGVPDGYPQQFPGEVRSLTGAGAGVLLAQQTAANLHAAPGVMVSIGREGLPAVSIPVDGVVDLPAADSLFQRIGATAHRAAAGAAGQRAARAGLPVAHHLRSGHRAATGPGHHPGARPARSPPAD